MWLRAQTANEKLKHNEQKLDVDCMQAMSVLSMTHLKAISQQKYVLSPVANAL